MTGKRGRQHHEDRLRWKTEVNRGTVNCSLCGQPIHPNQDWDLDHTTPLALGGHPNGPKHPAHATCNRAEGAHITNRRVPSRLAL